MEAMVKNHLTTSSQVKNTREEVGGGWCFTDGLTPELKY